MRFGLLGPMEIRTDDGTALDPGGERPRALLALLALSAGRPVSAGRLKEELYGDGMPAGAANALQSQVSRLRRRLGPGGVRIDALPAGYRLDVEPGSVDAHRFAELAGEGRRALRAGHWARARELLREGLGLWRGEALADLGRLPFARVEAERLAGVRLDAREDLAQARLGLGEGAALVGELRELLRAHPVRERLYGLLMRALRAAGRPAEALAVYGDARRVLAAELGADPSPELAALHLELLSPERAVAPRPVPAALTGLIGRTRELADLGELLGGARLVTLTGPGGAGKTRLGEAAASRWAGEVCYVELAPVTDAADLSYAVLAALGVRESGFQERTGATERLLSALAAYRGRRLLLLLDNCEHLVDAAARLAGQLLAGCADLRILATSREGLGITGERLVAVEPLDAAAAVRLFLDRAAAVRPGLVLDPARVEHICAALDGLPLALELAAARLRTLTAEEIADRLDDRLLPTGSDDRFRLLSRGDRTKAARHRTLRAVVEWSWELLDEAERELARRLTVFAGGATPEAVERVCGVLDAQDVLASLVEKSLVRVVDGRYRMLETIRAFCAEQLGNEEAEFRAAFAAYFLELAESAEPLLRGPGQLRWLDRLDTEHANLLAAVRGGGASVSLRLLACLTWYGLVRGRAGELAVVARQLLAVLGEEPPAGLVEEYTLCLLAAAGNRDGDGAWEHLAARADALMHDLAARLRKPHALVLWSLVCGPRTDPGTTALTEAAYLGRDPWAVALLRMGRGFQELFAGRPGPAEEAFEAALTSFREAGDRWGTATALDSLATFAHWRGDSARALALLDEALAAVRELGAPEETADMLLRRGTVLLHSGQQAEAVALFTRSAELARDIGVPDRTTGPLRALGDAARLAGDTSRARAHYEAALEGCTATWFSNGEALRVLLGLGRTAGGEGDPVAAAEWFDRAAALAEDQPGRPVRAEIAEARAQVAAPERAAELLGEAERLRGTAVRGDLDVVRARRAARAGLSEEAYEAAYARGAQPR
ncbi:BTAD domain-containing putative transcriptional regulator [Streptomyces sp. NPDC051561]|uniref:BTAD domain-containing putative transcriptional regulator n=1 Tax=Streptomyces sp. NPDC051561 TaxID=3365658 RepID=UPI0037BB69E3